MQIGTALEVARICVNVGSAIQTTPFPLIWPPCRWARVCPPTPKYLYFDPSTRSRHHLILSTWPVEKCGAGPSCLSLAMRVGASPSPSDCNTCDPPSVAPKRNQKHDAIGPGSRAILCADFNGTIRLVTSAHWVGQASIWMYRSLLPWHYLTCSVANTACIDIPLMYILIKKKKKKSPQFNLKKTKIKIPRKKKNKK